MGDQAHLEGDRERNCRIFQQKIQPFESFEELCFNLTRLGIRSLPCLESKLDRSPSSRRSLDLNKRQLFCVHHCTFCVKFLEALGKVDGDLAEALAELFKLNAEGNLS